MRVLRMPSDGVVRPAGLGALAIRLPRIQLALVCAVALAQIAWIARGFNGMSSSEAQLGMVGLRVLDGHALSDRSLEFISGSHAWPALSAAGYRADAAGGSRFIALALMALAGLALYAATRRMFGEIAATWSALLFAVSAPVLAVSHQALMEPLAIAAMAVGLWAATRLAAEDHRKWVAVIAAAMVLTSLAQYRAAFAIVPISIVISVLRGKRSHIDLVVLWSVVVLALIVYFDAFADQLDSLSGRDVLFNPYDAPAAFASTRAKLLLMLLWGAMPIAAALVARRRAATHQRLIGALLVVPALWIALLIAFVDFDRSLVFPDLALGLIFVLPVLGLALSTIPATAWNLATLMAAIGLVAAIGAAHVAAFDRSWVDYRPVNGTLARETGPGVLVLANDPWPVRVALYESGNIASGEDVIDEATILGSDSIFDFCQISWVVTETLIQPWSSFVGASIESCGDVEQVYASRFSVEGLSPALLPETRRGDLTITRNNQPFESEPS